MNKIYEGNGSDLKRKHVELICVCALLVALFTYLAVIDGEKNSKAIKRIQTNVSSEYTAGVTEACKKIVPSDINVNPYEFAFNQCAEEVSKAISASKRK